MKYKPQTKNELKELVKDDNIYFNSDLEFWKLAKNVNMKYAFIDSL
ncbi:hypothetical protein R4K92_14050 [Brachyspira intermedia]